MRIEATAWFLEGDRLGALRAWNALGEPTVDLVQVLGLHATRHAIATRRLGIPSGTMLTPAALDLAERRLEGLPAIEAARVAYQPYPDGSVDVRAAVLERARWPSPTSVAFETTRALLREEGSLTLGPIMGTGDRWTLAGSWNSAEQNAGGSVATSADGLPGIWEVAFDWRRERFRAVETGSSDPTILSEERLRGTLNVREWISAKLRVGAGVGIERWRESGRMGVLLGDVRWIVAGGRGAIDGDVQLWTVVRGSDLEEGESQGLPVWSRHVGDPILESNLTRRIDFALFMVEALKNDELIQESPAIVGCRTPSALAHACDA
jgi:hypothetical protein